MGPLRTWLVGMGIVIVAGTLAEAAEINNSIGIKLVLIPAGEFMMGSGESANDLAKAFAAEEVESDSIKHEYPQHRVRISKPFYLSAHEVTVGQFGQFIKATAYKTDAEKDGEGGVGIDGTTFEQKPEYIWRNTGFEQTDDHPVAMVSWNDAVAFCTWLSEKEGRTYRLPTEAEWEYACRAGTTTRWWHGDDAEKLAEVGNVADGTLRAKLSPKWKWAIVAKDGHVFTAPVGQFKANPFGLHDMHGNVLEWCQDWYESGYYARSPADDPNGPASGTSRVLRGGSWADAAHYSRSAFRYWNLPDSRGNGFGFRPARTL